jgi:hypothetical protein
MVYKYAYDDPESGIIADNSQNTSAVRNAMNPLIKTLITKDGPEYYAATPDIAKIPAPMMLPSE